MAKFLYTKDVGELRDPMSPVLFVDIETKSKTKLVLADDDGDKLVYSGRGFKFDGDEAIGGVVSKVEIFADGKLLLSITDCSFKLAELDLANVHNNDDVFMSGDDTFVGSRNGDYFPLYGPNEGDDIIRGMGGNDRILASPGANRIDGGAGDRDILDYSIYDQASNLKRGIEVDMATGRIVNSWKEIDRIKHIEVVYGTYLDDEFTGSKRRDIFGGYLGDDRLTGGKGADDFEFYSMLAFGVGNGSDTIVDFGDGKDSVVLGGFAGVSSFADLKPLMKQKGSDLSINFGGGEEVVFLNTGKGDLKAADFEFV
jgi:Ca2+-binding RTX toxin-like protein